MAILGFDLETYLIRPDNPLPRPVVASVSDGDRSGLCTPAESIPYIWNFDHVLAGHNIAYDIMVMMRWFPETIPAWIYRLDGGLVHDTGIYHCLQYLDTIGAERYDPTPSLSSLEKIYLSIDRSEEKKGNAIWRTRYGTLDGTPIADWPHDAQQYALEDARNTALIAQLQSNSPMVTFTAQVRASVALHATSDWGMRVHHDRVQQLKRELFQKRHSLDEQIGHHQWSGQGSKARLAQAVRQAWSRKQMLSLYQKSQQLGFSINWQLYPQDRLLQEMDDFSWTNEPDLVRGLISACPQPKCTKTGISTDASVLEELAEYHEDLGKFVEMRHVDKMINTYVSAYEGIEIVHPWFITLVSTGRTGCREPNMQNIPREAVYRRLFRTRPGYQFGTVDYSALELVTLAATIAYKWPGHKCRLRDLINAGMDVHSMIASHNLGRPYEEIVDSNHKVRPEYKRDRQGAKASSFGYPGGLGPAAFMGYAKAAYGVEFTLEQARDIRRAWSNALPEMDGLFLRYCGEQVRHGNAVAELVNGRRKAGCRFTQFANFHFQGLAADGAKRSLYALWRECLGSAWCRNNRCRSPYMRDVEESPLSHSHPCNFVHDEIVCEHPTGDADALRRQEEIMIENMSDEILDLVAVRVEGHLGDDWQH